MAQIHYCLAFATEQKKWVAADEAMGGFFTEGFVFEGDEETGKWRTLNIDDSDEMDLEYDLTMKVGEMLKWLNQDTDI